jgi:hypothetical protein
MNRFSSSARVGPTFNLRSDCSPGCKRVFRVRSQNLRAAHHKLSMSPASSAMCATEGVLRRLSVSPACMPLREESSRSLSVLSPPMYHLSIYLWFYYMVSGHFVISSNDAGLCMPIWYIFCNPNLFLSKLPYVFAYNIMILFLYNISMSVTSYYCGNLTRFVSSISIANRLGIVIRYLNSRECMNAKDLHFVWFLDTHRTISLSPHP